MLRYMMFGGMKEEMYSLEERNYCRCIVNSLKNEGIHGIKTGYCNCLPKVKLLMIHNAAYYYRYKSMNQLLIQEFGFSKTTASELITVANTFYNNEGVIDPFFKDFQYTVLVKLAQKYKKNSIQLLKDNNVLSPRLTRDNLDWVHRQYCRLLFGNDYSFTVG